MKSLITVLSYACLSVMVSGLTQTGTGTVSMDTILNHLLQLGQNIVNISYKLDYTVAGLKSQIQHTEAHLSHTKSALKKAHQQLNSVSTRLTSVEDNMRGKDSQLMNLTKVMGNLGSHVAYQVHLKTELRMIMRDKEVLKFDTVTLNKGDAYNPTTGIFTAPKSGTYLFWAVIESGDKGSFAIVLKKEGVILIHGYIPGDVMYGNAVINYITQVKKGEHVWFENSQRETLTKIECCSFSSYGGMMLNSAYDE